MNTTIVQPASEAMTETRFVVEDHPVPGRLVLLISVVAPFGLDFSTEGYTVMADTAKALADALEKGEGQYVQAGTDDLFETSFLVRPMPEETAEMAGVHGLLDLIISTNGEIDAWALTPETAKKVAELLRFQVTEAVQ